MADDVGAKKDIPALLNKSGDELVEIREDNGNITFVIKKA
ncbi:MAG: sulfurtransferase TusA family protein [Promethearchaeota archaeon]